MSELAKLLDKHLTTRVMADIIDGLNNNNEILGYIPKVNQNIKDVNELDAFTTIHLYLDIPIRDIMIEDSVEMLAKDLVSKGIKEQFSLLYKTVLLGLRSLCAWNEYIDVTEKKLKVWLNKHNSLISNNIKIKQIAEWAAIETSDGLVVEMVNYLIPEYRFIVVKYLCFDISQELLALLKNDFIKENTDE